MENKKMLKEVDTDIELTEEDIQHLLKSEEDVRMGKVYTMEEFTKRFEERHGLKF